MNTMQRIIKLREEAFNSNKPPSILVLSLGNMLCLNLDERHMIPTKEDADYHLELIDFYIHTSLYGMDIQLGKRMMVL